MKDHFFIRLFFDPSLDKVVDLILALLVLVVCVLQIAKAPVIVSSGSPSEQQIVPVTAPDEMPKTIPQQGPASGESGQISPDMALRIAFSITPPALPFLIMPGVKRSTIQPESWASLYFSQSPS